jgi:hypothetical protein
MVYIDQNAARNPRFPLESLFRALSIENPEFNIGDVDLVTDRNNIRKLLRFVQASSNDTFQIKVEIAGDKTALFTRVEEKTKEIIQGFRGYGHSFEKAYTKTPSGSTAHHRIVGYNFGGLKCVVRHETDGYVENKSPRELADSLSDALKGLSISKSDSVISPSGAVIVETDGRAVDLSSILEIKTRAASRKLDMTEVSSQLWISQTPNLAVGYHRNGVFDDVQVRDMTEQLRQWEILNQSDLCKLAGLLTKIIEVVKLSGDRSALVQYDGLSGLRILAGKGKRALPDDLYAKWEQKGKGDIEHSTQAGQEDITELKIKDNDSQATSDQPHSGQGAGRPLIPSGTPFSDTIDYALRKGFRQFFRRMPAQLSDYDALCKTLLSLPIDVLAGRGVRDVMSDFRQGKSDWDPEERREIKGSKNLARDSAFRLLYLILVDGSALEARDRNLVYNATEFVVSHSRIFKCKTRRMVRAAFEDRFHISDKQRKILDKWPIGSEMEGEDVTTEEESYDYFDSDYDSDYGF